MAARVRVIARHLGPENTVATTGLDASRSAGMVANLRVFENAREAPQIPSEEQVAEAKRRAAKPSTVIWLTGKQERPGKTLVMGLYKSDMERAQAEKVDVAAYSKGLYLWRGVAINYHKRISVPDAHPGPSKLFSLPTFACKSPEACDWMC